MRDGNGLPCLVIGQTGGDDLFVNGRHGGGAFIGDREPEALGYFHFALLGQAQERIYRVGGLSHGAHDQNGGIGMINGERAAVQADVARPRFLDFRLKGSRRLMRRGAGFLVRELSQPENDPSDSQD